MEYFDTHCHLDELVNFRTSNFSFKNLEDVGIKKIIIPATSSANWSVIEEIGLNFENVYFAFGIHPLYIKSNLQQELYLLTDKLKSKPGKCIAIGEIGLDSTSDVCLKIQQDVFLKQIELANQYSLPVICHSRKTHDILFKLLKEHPVKKRGVIHGFSGSFQQAQNFISLGFYIGVGGTITYMRANKTKNTIAKLPLNRLVLETDSPYMPVCGYQGIPNHPLHIIDIFKALVELRVEPAELIAKKLYKNSLCLFKI